MKSMTVELKGTGPLITHNNRGANPLGIWAKEMKKLTSKRNKTDENYHEIARMEWEAGLYLEEGKVALPARIFTKCFLLGAKKSKNGPKFQTGVMVDSDYAELEYEGKKIDIEENGKFPDPNLNEFYDLYKHQCMVKVQNNQVLRTRPMFQNWSCKVNLLYFEDTIDKRTILKSISDAGRFVGLCEMRPYFGKFEVSEIK